MIWKTESRAVSRSALSYDKTRHFRTGQHSKVQSLQHPPITPVYAAENGGFRSLAGDAHRQAWLYLVDVLELALTVKEALYAFGYDCGVCGLREIGHKPNAVSIVVLGDDTLRIKALCV